MAPRKTKPTRKKAAKPTPRAAINAASNVRLNCTDLRHAWEYVGTPQQRNSRIWRTLQCNRCGTQATDVLRLNGARDSGRRYSYPDGYLFGVKVELNDIRRESIARISSVAEVL